MANVFGKTDTKKLNGQFEAMKKLSTNNISIAMAKVVMNRSQELVPVLSGELKDSGEIVQEGDEVAVVYTAGHAIPVEFGTYKMAAQPYLRPAIDENQAEILDAAANETQREINGAL